jgi:hypothetical protein
MKLTSKTPLEIHRELLSTGLFSRETQAMIASRTRLHQATISRIAGGRFKKINKSVLAVCKYASINPFKTSGLKQLRSLLASRENLVDPQKKKLVHIIELAVDLLERS